MADATPTETEIAEWCTARLAKVLKVSVERVDPQATFPRLGVDSTSAVIFAMDIEEWLDLDVPADITVKYKSIAELSLYLAKRCADRHAASVGSR